MTAAAVSSGVLHTISFAIRTKLINSKPYRTLVSIRCDFNTFNFSVFPLLHLFDWRVSDFVTIFRNLLGSACKTTKNHFAEDIEQSIEEADHRADTIYEVSSYSRRWKARRLKYFKLIVYRAHKSCRASAGKRTALAFAPFRRTFNTCEIKIRAEEKKRPLNSK